MAKYLINISKLHIIYVAVFTNALFQVSKSDFIIDRYKRDDGSFAQDFGGPIAQASGPEDSSEIVNSPIQQNQKQQNQIVSSPPTDNKTGQNNLLPTGCKFRNRNRRDVGGAFEGFGGPVAQKGEPETGNEIMQGSENRQPSTVNQANTVIRNPGSNVAPASSQLECNNNQQQKPSKQQQQIQNPYGKRTKRDDGSFATDFGGPVAQSSSFEDSTDRNKIGSSLKEKESNSTSNGNNVNNLKESETTRAKENQGLKGKDMAMPPAAVPPTNVTTTGSRQCLFEKKENQVLSIVSNNEVGGKARREAGFLPKHISTNQTTMANISDVENPTDRKTKNFQFLNVTKCETAESCFSKCQSIPQCNYVMRSTFNSISYLYNIKADKLQEGIYTTSISYDSIILKCNSESTPAVRSQLKKEERSIVGGGGSGYGLPPPTTAKPKSPCSELITENEAKSEFDKYLNTFTEKYREPPEPATPAPQVGGYGQPPPTAPPPPTTPTPTKKSYADPTEHQKRYQIFKDNLQIIKQYNCQDKDDPLAAKFEVTEFSDQSYEEFIADSGGSLKELGEPHLKPDVLEPGKQRLEKCPKLNWAERGVVPAPRRQGKCGSCYAFSSSDLVASQYHIDRKLKGQTFTLAPQYVIDCMKQPVALGCNGGRPIEVLRNFTKCTDPVGCNWPKEECYPYKNKKDACAITECQKTPKIPVRFATINDLTGPNEKEKVAALLNWGPAVAIVDASATWQLYKGGIIREKQCTKNQNHAVLLVGYDYSGPVPYYIIKNSWGTSWGENGFVKVEADKNVCAIAKSLTFCCTHNCDQFKDSTDLANRPNSENCV